MDIKVNGQKEILHGEIRLTELLQGKQLNLDNVIVEYNGTILRRQQWDGITVTAGDELEIVSFVGGG